MTKKKRKKNTLRYLNHFRKQVNALRMPPCLCDTLEQRKLLVQLFPKSFYHRRTANIFITSNRSLLKTKLGNTPGLDLDDVIPEKKKR